MLYSTFKFIYFHQGLPKYTSGTNWWLTTCDGSVFAGTYVEIMDFSQCVAWCRDLSFGEQQGDTFTAGTYLHLTPANQYRWNTKSDQNDRNNGCLCRLDTV